VKLFASKVYNRKMTANVLVQFSELVKKSAQQLLQEMVSEQLPAALAKATESIDNQQVNDKGGNSKVNLITTTPLELEGFFVVKSILRPLVDGERLAYRDAQSYCAILLDDNNRKTICRLYFNSAKKYIALMDASKKEVKMEIKHLDDIYTHTRALTATTNMYLNASASE
jgi:predicted type IV restriction endonuclease